MIDLHAHVLPGVDDGAEDFETAVALCRLAAEDGCEALAATPHQRHQSWWNTDAGRLQDLRDRLQRAIGPRPRLLSGGEIRIGPGLLADLDRPDRAGLQPLAGSRYLLLEFARFQPHPAPTELVHELVVAGWRPILAHPEMIAFLSADLELMHRLEAAGALFQLTAMSLTGEFGGRIRRRAREMVRAGLAHFVASDCHSIDRRPPGLSAARRELGRLVGSRSADRLVRDNPLAVLENRPLHLATVG